MNLHYGPRQVYICLLCLVALSCQEEAKFKNLGRNGLADHSDVELLQRIEKAGNRYRAAIDLLKYSSSAVERSLAESHLQLTREILENEFQLAEIESKDLVPSEAPTAKPASSPGGPKGQDQYEKAAAEVWKVYRDVENASRRLDTARQNLKRASTAEAFRRAQEAVERAQEEVTVASRKLDLAGSNLDIEDYRRKKGAPAVIESHSLSEHVKMLREELVPTATKPNASSTAPPNLSEDLKSRPFPITAGRSIVAGSRDFFSRQAELQTLRQSHRESLQSLDESREELARLSQQLETLQVQHMELNQKAQQAYNKVYELLKSEGEKSSTAELMEEADKQMSTSVRYDQQKEIANRGMGIIRKQAVLVREDSERLLSWVGVALGERNKSLVQLSTRLGIVLGLILSILIVAHYLKKLPYRFIKEGKNLYYFRKLISFSSGVVIVLIILLNFVGDFGSISAVVGLAGAGLAIALQDPIVSLVGWFLVIGKFGISVGDRIEINNVKGDVIDIGLLRIAVLEVGNWVSAEQSTGRVVFFPNSFIFKGHFFNYSTGNSFIWDEIHITVTYESNWKRAREIIEDVARRVSDAFVEAARLSQERVSRRFHINLGTLTPYVYVSIAESGVDLILRYLTEVRRRRTCHDQICREVLEALSNEPGIDLAYPTRRNVTETRVLPTLPEPSPR
jgi:small-conductance mechanosensitive channel